MENCGDLLGYSNGALLQMLVFIKACNPWGFNIRAKGEIEKILNGEPWDEYDIDETKYFGNSSKQFGKPGAFHYW